MNQKHLKFQDKLWQIPLMLCLTLICIVLVFADTGFSAKKDKRKKNTFALRQTPLILKGEKDETEITKLKLKFEKGSRRKMSNRYIKVSFDYYNEGTGGTETREYELQEYMVRTKKNGVYKVLTEIDFGEAQSFCAKANEEVVDVYAFEHAIRQGKIFGTPGIHFEMIRINPDVGEGEPWVSEDDAFDFGSGHKILVFNWKKATYSTAFKFFSQSNLGFRCMKK